MAVSDYASLLTRFVGSSSKQETDDYGRPLGEVEVIAPFSLYGIEQDSAEQIRAGVESSESSFYFITASPKPEKLTPAAGLDVSYPDGTKLGRMNVRKVLHRPSESLYELEADLISNA